MSIQPDVISRLKEAAGPNGFTEDPREIAPHLVEWRGKYHGRSALLLKPRTTAEVARILAICNETRTPIVPQGGNTGLVGGQIPFDGEALLSLSRLNRIRTIDADGMSAIAEAGVILTELQRAADKVDRFFPLSLASEGSCTIGGTVSTNAGGVNVLRYGNMRELVVGLEVVLADGRVLDLLRTLRKDNTGYDLKHLFIGAEGTLGIVTAAALKLFPKPAERVTAFVAVPDVESAIALLHAMQGATGGLVSAFELVPRIGLEMVAAHIPQTHDPLTTPSSWYVLAEAASGGGARLQDTVEQCLAAATENRIVTDAVIAASETQRAALWRLRESLSEAQKYEGGSIKHDVSVPIAAIPDFIARGIAAVEARVPGVRPVPFGHLGDGNIHFNFSVPKDGDSAAFVARWEEINRVVHDIVHAFGGSISAEHGIGVMKRDEMLRYKSAAEIETMRALKRVLDPNNILNPGKVIRI
ncbi:MAG TPA: FAD-binding oxidoreductase [Rhizomicrobium sp.]|jgi:FAD/FMN-containing dehydrogenase|nr:FAD-binding oxidoreductase [Rhizomicrobium sp.]